MYLGTSTMHTGMYTYMYRYRLTPVQYSRVCYGTLDSTVRYMYSSAEAEPILVLTRREGASFVLDPTCDRLAFACRKRVPKFETIFRHGVDAKRPTLQPKKLYDSG